jgi:hypothetical protein
MEPNFRILEYECYQYTLQEEQRAATSNARGNKTE